MFLLITVEILLGDESTYVRQVMTGVDVGARLRLIILIFINFNFSCAF